MLNQTVHTYRNAYAGLSRSTWLLSLIMLINRSGTMVVPFMTIYLTSAKMGYSIGKAGVVLGMFGIGAFVGAWCGGRLTDKIGFYPVQVITLIGGGILFMILGQMKTYPLICLFTFLVSFINEAFRPANSTAIAYYSKPENRTRSYALNRLAINLGWALGSAIGGVLAGISYELLFWVDGVTNICAAGLMLLLIKPVQQVHKKEETESGSQAAVYRDRVFMRFIFFTFLFSSCFFQIFNNLSAYFKNEVGLSEPFIGGLMAVSGIIIALVEMALVYKLEGKRRSLTYITTGVAICGVAFLLLLLPGQARLVAPLVIITITVGEMLSLPFMNSFWISRAHASNRGQYAAYYTMAWSAAQTLGPMLGAQLANSAGFAWLWCALGGICLITAYGFKKMNT